MFELKLLNVIKVVADEAGRDKLLAQGYELVQDVEEVSSEEPKPESPAKKSRKGVK